MRGCRVTLTEGGRKERLSVDYPGMSVTLTSADAVTELWGGRAFIR